MLSNTLFIPDEEQLNEKVDSEEPAAGQVSEEPAGGQDSEEPAAGQHL